MTVCVWMRDSVLFLAIKSAVRVHVHLCFPWNGKAIENYCQSCWRKIHLRNSTDYHIESNLGHMSSMQRNWQPCAKYIFSCIISTSKRNITKVEKISTSVRAHAHESTQSNRQVQEGVPALQVEFCESFSLLTFWSGDKPVLLLLVISSMVIPTETRLNLDCQLLYQAKWHQHLRDCTESIQPERTLY